MAKTKKYIENNINSLFLIYFNILISLFSLLPQCKYLQSWQRRMNISCRSCKIYFLSICPSYISKSIRPSKRKEEGSISDLYFLDGLIELKLKKVFPNWRNIVLKILFITFYFLLMRAGFNIFSIVFLNSSSFVYPTCFFSKLPSLS